MPIEQQPQQPEVEPGNLDNEPVSEPEGVDFNDLSERKKLFDAVQSPEDIFRLPPPLRREGLEKLKNRAEERYLLIADLQKEFFDYIGESYEKGTLTKDTLIAHIDQMLDNPLITEDDKRVVDKLLYRFLDDYENIEQEALLSDSELLKKYSLYIHTLDESSLKGSFEVRRTPFSLNFLFSDKGDFDSFISSMPGDFKKYTNTSGLSYFRHGIPITATAYFSESTYKHEIQHKEFDLVNTDSVLIDSKLEGQTRNEILSFYVGNETAHIYNPLVSIDSILINNYKFHNEYGVGEAEYRKMIHDAVTAIGILEEIFSEQQEIVNILRREPLYLWKKVAKRVRQSEKAKLIIENPDIASIAKLRRDVAEKEEKERKIFQKELRETRRAGFLERIKMSLSEPIILKRNVNEKGNFYAKVDTNTIVGFLKKRMGYYDSFRIYRKNIILESKIETFGEHTFIFSYDGEKLPGFVLVEKHQ